MEVKNSMAEKGMFFDLDGTLWNNNDPKLSEKLVQTLKCMQQKEYSLFINTGRTFRAIPKEIKQAIKWDGFICNNGQMVYDCDGSMLFSHNYPEAIYTRLLEIANENDLCMEIKTSIKRYLTRECDDLVKIAHQYFGLEIPEVLGHTIIDPTEVTAMMVYGKKEELDLFNTVDEINVVHGESYFADLMLRGINKYSGLNYMKEYKSINFCIAFGDSNNDYEMLKYADIGIAMGNSSNEIKGIADYVTAPVHEDGVFSALVEYFSK
ncbi:HAD family hydrolase [Enterococcus sp. DIV0187]|uniref:HAD family hydrolase n=1 Tax=Enterococcus sp. DIV0187 TaxID=2774644 RepID=UPI003F1F319B